MFDSRFIIGVDLGTTNIALFYIDTERTDTKIQQFKISQLVAPGEIDELSLLPSFCYLPSPDERSREILNLPWDAKPDVAVGKFARDHGASIPGQLVVSAKSWLAHAGVDRTKPILPWGNDTQVHSKSPVEVSAHYLSHLKNAWNHKYKRVKDRSGSPCLFEDQQIIITIPASFDETARELTIAAARLAQLNKITLVEEPLAAFYAWLYENENDWQSQINPGEMTLVVDVGGGTTDFSLIEMDENNSLHRSAVGDHLLLGGDNIDMAIARKIEKSWGDKLDANEWSKLCQLCRNAKETLLSSDRDKTDITLMASGSSILGNLKKSVLHRKDLVEMLEKGFYPQVDPESLTQAKRSGIREMGLPYAANPAVTEHLLQFLRYAKKVTRSDKNRPTNGSENANRYRDQKRVDDAGELSSQDHSGNEDLNSKKRDSTGSTKTDGMIYPDRILFNGGSMISEVVRKRVISVVSSWFPKRPAPIELKGGNFSLAVALGAAYYGRVRRGHGVKVRGGIARSYYLEVKDRVGKKEFVCIMSRDTEENIQVSVPGAFLLQTSKKVLFNLYSSATRLLDKPGERIKSNEELTLVAPLVTVLQFGKTESKSVEVTIGCEETEAGALKVYLDSAQTHHLWPLHFDLRPIPEQLGTNSRQATVVLDSRKLLVAKKLLTSYFSSPTKKLPSLMNDLENSLQIAKNVWSLPLIRDLADTTLDLANCRTMSAPHEARWLNVLGFLLRPGFGDPGDELRIRKVWKLWFAGPTHHKDTQAIAEWWVLWRRVAAGLKGGHQLAIASILRKNLIPKSSYREKFREGVQAKKEMWRCLGSLELLPVAMKTTIGSILLNRKSKLDFVELWVLARLGARKMFHAPANYVISASTASQWLNQLMQLKLSDRTRNPALFAIARIAGVTGDRSVDLPQDILERAHQFLKINHCKAAWLEHLTHQAKDSVEETEKLIADTLPLGLSTVGDSHPTKLD